MITLSGRSETGIAVAALLLLLAPSATPAQVEVGPAKQGSYLTPPEIMKLAEDSTLVYEVRQAADLKDATVDQFVDLFWPAGDEDRGYPVVSEKGPGGERGLTYDLLEKCQSRMARAEAAFDRKDYRTAQALYRKVMKKEPDCHLAPLFLGDSFLYAGEAREALAAYEQAIARNPHDFRGPFFRASALTTMGRIGEARASYVRALALRPHRKSLHDAIRLRAAELGITLMDEPFRPRAFARREGEKIAVYLADPDESWWLVYGMCKGIWIGEQSHREARTGRPGHDWSAVEEQDCIAAMLDNYVALREEGKADPQPQLERIFSVLKEGLLFHYVLYEIGYRLAPDMTLLLPEKKFAEVSRYVETFVIPRSPAP